MINPLSGFPPLPVPVLPESYDNSLSFYELLTKCWNQVQTLTTTCNSLLQRVTQIEQLIDDVPDLASAVQQLQGDVAQLQLDLAAETQARSDGYDTLYDQINQVRTLVLNEYVSNDDLAAVLAGGIKISLITKAAYDELDPPDASTLYVITDNGSVSLALAGTPVGGSSAATVTLAANTASSGEAHSIELDYPHFSCDTGYYFDSQVTCTLNSRQYTKKDILPAIGMIIYTNGYSTPFFISTVESAVAYSVSGFSDAQAVYSVNYDGVTWYYSDIPYAMSGVWNDSEGHLLTYSGTVNFDASNDRVMPEAVLEILQAIHAQKED